MSLSGARPLNPLIWLGAPLLTCMALTVLFAMPIKIFGLRPPEPLFAMVPAFAWPLIRPSILAPFALLLLGLFLDLFWGAPIGFWPLSLLTAYGAVLVGRSMMAGQSIPMMFGWFAAACALVLATGFLFTMLRAAAMPSFLAVAWQFLATILLFPFAYRLIDRFEDADVRFR